MRTNEDNALELVELGSVTADTQGKGGPFPETYVGMTIPGLTDE